MKIAKIRNGALGRTNISLPTGYLAAWGAQSCENAVFIIFTGKVWILVKSTKILKIH